MFSSRKYLWALSCNNHIHNFSTSKSVENQAVQWVENSPVINKYSFAHNMITIHMLNNVYGVNKTAETCVTY